MTPVSKPPEKSRKSAAPCARKAANEVERYVRLVEMVVDFLTEKYEFDVEEAFYCDWSNVFPGGPDDADGTPLLATFHDWLIHAAGIIEPGYSGIGLYLEKNGEGLDDADRALLCRMDDSMVSLFDLRRDDSGSGVVCGDLLLGDEFVLDGENIVLDGDRMLAAARRMIFDGKPALCMGIYPFEYGMKDELLAEILTEFEEYRVEEPGVDMARYLKNADPLPDMWLDDFEETYGEQLPPVTFTALFDILDEEGTRARLASMAPLLQRERDLFEWTGDDGDSGQRGAVVIMNGTLALGAFSPDLREAGKVMLLSACAELIRHKSDIEVDTDGQFDLPG